MRAASKPSRRPVSASRPRSTRSFTSPATGTAVASSSSFPAVNKSSTPLALALHAQWSLLQQALVVGGIPVSAERDLLRVLESLPEHKAAILSDVEGILPYILAFAVAPIPTERTQVIALEALRAAIGSLVSVWGKSASAVLVHDFLVVEHNALQALEVAISVAFGGDDDITGSGMDMRETRNNSSRRTVAHSAKSTAVKKKTVLSSLSSSSLHRAVTTGVLELLLVMITVSAPTAAAALSYPSLLRSVARCIPLLAPVQACDAASILHALSGVSGAADVFVTCGVCDYALQYIFSCTRDAPHATVTALILVLRFSVVIASARGSFDALCSDPAAPRMFEELLHSEWDEVVALGVAWLSTSLAQHRGRSSTLASALLRETRVGARLAPMTLSFSHAAASATNSAGPISEHAARCWRELTLAAPTDAAAFFLSIPEALLALVQVLGASETETKGSEEIVAVAANVAVALGLCAGWTTSEMRVALHRALLRRIAPAAQAIILRRLSTLLQSAAAAEALASLPPLASARETSAADSSDAEESGGGEERRRRRVLRALLRLFGGEARGPSAIPPRTTRTPSLRHSRAQSPQPAEAAHDEPSPFSVVRRAEQMGGVFYIDSIQSILCLAHHYAHTPKAAAAPAPRRAGKTPNPWAPPVPVESSRRWSVEDLHRSDAVLFYVSYDRIVAELTEAIEAVEEHTRRLGETLRVCPTRVVRRRCLLNDLYMHVYPKMHMFLRFIQHHLAHSRLAVQVIAEGPRAIHSGNVLQLYEAIGHCVSTPAEEVAATRVTSRESSLGSHSYR